MGRLNVNRCAPWTNCQSAFFVAVLPWYIDGMLIVLFRSKLVPEPEGYAEVRSTGEQKKIKRLLAR